jgi:hypothetical protein
MAHEDNLEIPLHQFLNVANFKKLVDIRVERGFLVRDGAVEEWTFSGYRYRDGVPRLYGPAGGGEPLAAALARPREEALAAAGRIVRALGNLEGKADKIEIGPAAVWLFEDGGVLFLPAEVFRKIRLLSDDADKAAFSRLNDPYEENAERRLSYSVGALLYRILAGAFPFEGKNLDEIHARIRRRKVLPPQYLFPALKKDVSDLFCRFFEKKLPLTIADWGKALAGWLADGYVADVSGEEAADIGRRREKLEAQLDRGIRRTAFFEKYGKTIFITAAALVVAGVVAGFIIANLLKPRSTAGFPPLKLVETYYQSIDALNPELMRDCLKGDAGAGELQRAEFMFVNNRQLVYLTNKNDRLSGGEWEKEGRPRIDMPSYVDGVTGLVIREVSGGTAPVFEAEYDRWLEEPESNSTSAVLLQRGYHMKDRLTLTKDDQGWLISDLTREENRLFYSSPRGLDPSLLAPAKPEAKK